MDFSYYNSNGKLTKLNVHVGAKWNAQKTSHKLINNIFTLVDNGDGIAQENEVFLLNQLFKIADNSIKGNQNNKILISEELNDLTNKINSNKINLHSMKCVKAETVDLNFYSYESLKQRYPEKDYEFEYYNWPDDSCSCIVKSKKTNKRVISSNISHTKDKCSCVIIYDSQGEEKEYLRYSNNGTLEMYRDKHIDDEFHYPICEKLHYYLDVSDQSKMKVYIGRINEYNIYDLIRNYEDRYRSDLLEDMKKIKNVQIRTYALNHIQDALEKFLHYKKGNWTKEHSQIATDYYTGRDYSIKYSDSKITIIDNKTKVSKTLDVDNLTKNLKLIDKISIKAVLQTIPAEALLDIIAECKPLASASGYDKANNGDGVKAYYYPTTDRITVGIHGFLDNREFIHELGHAIDWTKSYKFFNSAESDSYKDFKNAFEEELKNFEKDHGTYKEIVKRQPLLSNQFYATKNIYEMFAECYTLLMLNDCQSRGTIRDYFPKTLEASKKLLAHIRNYPQSKRH